MFIKFWILREVHVIQQSFLLFFIQFILRFRKFWILTFLICKYMYIVDWKKESFFFLKFATVYTGALHFHNLIWLFIIKKLTFQQFTNFNIIQCLYFLDDIYINENGWVMSIKLSRPLFVYNWQFFVQQLK